MNVVESRLFDPASLGYQVCHLAHKGRDLPLFIHLINQDPNTAKSLVVVTPEGSRYTPLHYALNNKEDSKYAFVASLVNRVVSWSIPSKPTPEKTGNSPIQILMKIPNGFENLLTELVNSEEPLNVEGLIELLKQPLLSTDCRRKILENKDLIKKLCSKLSKSNALFVISSLMIGSYKWKSGKTDTSRWLQEENSEIYNQNKTMCCYEMIQYALVLMGETTIEQNHKEFAESRPIMDFISRATQATLNKLGVEIPNALKFIINQSILESLVSGRSDELVPLNLNTKYMGPPMTQVVYLTVPRGRGRSPFFDGYVMHFGLLHRNSSGDSFIHITESTKTVVLEDAKGAIFRESHPLGLATYAANPRFVAE